MEFRYLGNSGLKVSAVSYGNWVTHGSQVEADQATAARLRLEHDTVSRVVEQVRTTADSLSEGTTDLTLAVALLADLEMLLLPHERAEEQDLLPLLARAVVLATGGAYAPQVRPSDGNVRDCKRNASPPTPSS